MCRLRRISASRRLNPRLWLAPADQHCPTPFALLPRPLSVQPNDAFHSLKASCVDRRRVGNAHRLIRNIHHLADSAPISIPTLIIDPFIDITLAGLLSAYFGREYEAIRNI